MIDWWTASLGRSSVSETRPRLSRPCRLLGRAVLQLAVPMAPDGDEVICSRLTVSLQQMCDELRHELLKAAGANAAPARPLGVLHPNMSSAEIIVHASIDYLFSASMRRLSIDQKANLKVNSDHHATMPCACGRRAGLFQIVTERVMTYSHGAGGEDHLTKYGLPFVSRRGG